MTLKQLYNKACYHIGYKQGREDKILKKIHTKYAIHKELKHYKRHISELFVAFAEQWEGKSWKDVIHQLSITGNEVCKVAFKGKLTCNEIIIEIQRFRNKLVSFLQSEACKVSEADCDALCLSSGNNEITSDVDITIKGDCLDTNLYRLMAIRRFVSDYLNFAPFNGDIATISKFFDINFYLTDFAILLDENSIGTKLESYYLTTDQPTQLMFIQKSIDFQKDVVHDFGEYAKVVHEAKCVFDDVRNKGTDSDINRFINKLSNVALFQDECYVSQGAYIHVVCMMQEKLPFHTHLTKDMKKLFSNLMICSILENLNFAINHTDKSRGKYLLRVMDANLNRSFVSKSTSNDIISNTLKFVQHHSKGIKRLIETTHACRYATNHDKAKLSHMENEIKLRLMNVDVGSIAKAYNTIMKHAVDLAKNNQKPRINRYKKLQDVENNINKKNVNGKMCVVYIDKGRRQYIRGKSKYARLNDARQ